MRMGGDVEGNVGRILYVSAPELVPITPGVTVRTDRRRYARRDRSRALPHVRDERTGRERRKGRDGSS